MSDFTPFDSKMMQRCIELARQALGQTAPNPLVGAVVVQNGNIVGEGFHPGAGNPHAEIFALREAGEKAKKSTVYINLEPCNHFGRTPPCTDALISAGVSKVVAGMVDPNPLVSGGGIARLKQAGIEVLVGVEEAACKQLNEAFIHRILYCRPFGILKYAMTLDGKIATDTGHSAWVTSSESRAEVHKLRALCDAVIVGGNTVRRDNPLLTSRTEAHRNPLRVVMSRSLDLPSQAHLWDISEAATLVLTETGANPDFQAMLISKGVQIQEINGLTPLKAMNYLYKRGFLSVLWECGGTLAARAIADGTIQKVLAFIAPKIIGGTTAPSPVGDLGLINMTDAINLDRIKFYNIGTDYLLEGYLNRREDPRYTVAVSGG